MKITPASLAMALTNIVFHVLGGPTSKTPFGNFPPMVLSIWKSPRDYSTMKGDSQKFLLLLMYHF